MSDTAPASNLEKFTPRVFSGIQPSGGLTLGNYLGAMKRFVDMQDAGTHETVYCMVDMHAITVWQDPADLARNTRELCAGFIASGIDPERSILFNQSQVPEHAQLGWIFNCVARMGWMSRMTQWKDRAGKNQQNASLGLFAYPALMAADILVYHATHVPVGEDQKQHLELTRDIAIKFNNDFGVDFFPVTEPVIEGAATRVMSLRDSSKKMSKSDPSDASRINLTDDADAIAKKIRKAKTDPEPLPETLEGLEGRARGICRCAIRAIQTCACRSGCRQAGPDQLGNGAPHAGSTRDRSPACPRRRACARNRHTDPEAHE